MSKISEKNSLKIAFPVSSVWFGALVGPSMISGAFAASYFAPYGAVGLLLPFISMGIAAIIIAMGAEIVRREQVYTYSDFADCIYGGFRKYLTPVLELYMIIAMVVGGSAVVSMGGVFFSDMSGLPEITGAIAVSAISIVLVLWGEKLVRASSSFMSIIMIVGMVLLTVLAVINRSGDLKNILLDFSVPRDIPLSAGIAGAAALGFSNACNALTLSAVEQEVKTARHCTAIGICSFLLNSMAFILSTLLLLPYCPEVLKETVPTLAVINQFLAVKAPWLPMVYSVTMFFALLSSGAPQLHAVASRVRAVYPKTGILSGNTNRNLVTGVIYFTCCILISRFGLRAIISKGYAMLGYLAIPLIVLPICVLMPLRYYKMKNSSYLKEGHNETI